MPSQRCPSWRIVALFSLVFLALANLAWAQPVLRVADSHFTVNGRPKFLVFVSYYDGLRASDAMLDSDFAFLERLHVDGVRVWANWWVRGVPRVFASDTLLDGWTGAINEKTYGRLLAVLQRASAHKLLVDLTFAYDIVYGGSNETEIAGIAQITQRLRGQYPNVLFDLQNEWSNKGGFSADPQVLALRNAVKPYDPARIVTASSDWTVQYKGGAALSAAQAQLDVLAFHDPRIYKACGDPTNWWDATTQVVKDLRAASTLPIYLQEPDKIPTQCPSGTLTAGNYQTAVNNAKAAGAAAWTFHNRRAYDLSSSSFESQLADSPEEYSFLQNFFANLQNVKWGLTLPPPNKGERERPAHLPPVHGGSPIGSIDH